MKKFYLLLAFLAMAATFPVRAMEMEDELTASALGISVGDSSFSGVSVTSEAVYAGLASGDDSGGISLGGDSAAQQGIVTTASGGIVKKIAVSWGSAVGALSVYGSNEAYTSAGDLYDESTQGELLGTIAYGGVAELEIAGDYAYIGICASESLTLN